MIIGSHVSFKGDGLLGSTKEAISYGANTFMFYTGAPQNTVRKDIDPLKTKEAQALMLEQGIDLKNVICHAPYIINLANNLDERKWQFSIEFLKNELKRCDELGVRYLVLHPGSHVSLERSVGLENILNALNKVLESDFKCKILLETMALKGTEIGSLEEIGYLIKNTIKPVGVCIDTCHLNDAGYDLSDFNAFLETFDGIVGIDNIFCVHLNDSKNIIGSHKDRHENLGLGTIGFNTLLNICYNEKLKNVPKILETPYIGDTDDSKERKYPPYAYEIASLKKKEPNPNLLQDIRDYYNK